ncbi:metallophosphoesterase [uncultured Pseudoalteromonas sp.]|uniref:metallophosphoesterase n=1 Tax=uncultured Pseudoalteromonas sp. TaxID=114053 RepID=UPI002631259E|nr:metallophosphoesterase [uncultured Pseudoalteromonas sp.]
MFHIAITVGYLYLLWRFVWRLPLSRAFRTGMAIALLFVSEYHLLLTWVFGNMFSPEMPHWAILITSGAFCFFVLLLLLTLLVDILSVTWRCITKRSCIQYLGRWQISLFLTSLGLTVIGVHQAVQVPQVKTVELTLPGLAQRYDGTRIVQLSDLHISRLFDSSWANKVVEKTNSLNADLIVISGDLIDGTVSNREQDVAPLQRLSAPLGVYASLGNHEYYFDASRWAEKFTQLGIKVLINEGTLIGDDRFYLAGVTDEVASNFELQGPDLDAALKHAPQGLPKVLLKHQPQNALAVSQHGVGLQLSGHTHGGMIKGFDYLLGFFNQGLMSGQFLIGKMTLYVSNGTALWNGFPIRLGVPAEITEIVLRSSKIPKSTI